MVLKICVVCGAEFEARGRAICCSPACSRERKKETKRKWNKANPDKVNEYRRKWREANPDKVNEYNKQYYAENKEYKKEYNKQHYAENPEYYKQYYADRFNKLIEEAEKTGIDTEIIEACKKDMMNGGRALECYIDGTGNYYAFLCEVHEKYKGKCALTGVKSDLRVHHLNGYAAHPDGRCDVENGVLICEEVHKQFHGKYGRGDNTVEQWNEFVKEFEVNKVTLDNF